MKIGMDGLAKFFDVPLISFLRPPRSRISTRVVPRVHYEDPSRGYIMHRGLDRDPLDAILGVCNLQFVLPRSRF